MSEPRNASDDQHPPVSGPNRPENDSVGRPPITSRGRAIRPWLLFGVLVLLVGVLIVRDDLRQNAVNSSEKAARYVAFELLGWSPRDVFVWRLRLAGLADSPLGLQWTGAVERASERPLRVDGRYRISNAFADDQVAAHVYQITLKRGESLVWQLSRLDTSGSRFYASLERYDGDDQGWSSLTELGADGVTSNWVVPQSGNYRIVLQPELFGPVEYSLAIASGGSLPFPVEAASQHDIGGRFGAARDGGARKHHGVDIFAKRGTPVLAVIDGHARTGTGGIGGNHVWLSGGMLGFGRARYYYAHLDSFEIESGDSVKKGDILGYVGNTGNASTTPPHLHFGIYSGGPVDPVPFLKPGPVLPDR